MPIKPENRDRYPKDWPKIREAVRARAGNRCEWCGVGNQRLIWRLVAAPWLYRLDNPCDDGTNWRPVLIVCTVAHVFDKRPEVRDLENLAFLCQKCHLDHDRKK